MLNRLILAAFLTLAAVSAAHAQDADAESPQARPLITEGSTMACSQGP